MFWAQRSTGRCADSTRCTQTSVHCARGKYIVHHWTSREASLRHSSGWGTWSVSPQYRDLRTSEPDHLMGIAHLNRDTESSSDENCFNPYSAKGPGRSAIRNPTWNARGSRLLIFFTFEVEKLSTIHIWKPLHTFHSKVKAFTSEPRPYLLQPLTKISTLYNFYEWRV